MQELSAPPLQTPIVELSKAPGAFPGQMTKAFENWLRALVKRAQSAAYQAVAAVSVSGQNAAIALTSLIPSANGRYRVSYHARVTTAAGVSSSLQVTITATEGGVTCNYADAAYTGNATNAPQSGSFVVKADPSTPLSYSTAYASNAAGAMVYTLDITVEQLP
jgi:hypothetical protein